MESNIEITKDDVINILKNMFNADSLMGKITDMMMPNSTHVTELKNSALKNLNNMNTDDEKMNELVEAFTQIIKNQSISNDMLKLLSQSHNDQTNDIIESINTFTSTSDENIIKETYMNEIEKVYVPLLSAADNIGDRNGYIDSTIELIESSTYTQGSISEKYHEYVKEYLLSKKIDTINTSEIPNDTNIKSLDI